MDFEKVKEIIVETLSCDADKVTPDAAWRRIWRPIPWPPWSCPWLWRRSSV